MATHLPLSSRPATRWVNVKMTLAGSLSVKLKTVPTGGLRLREIEASFDPTRHVEADCLAPESTGGTGGVTLLGGEGGASTVTAALVAEAVTSCKA